MVKRIVICCDGTWNKPDGQNGASNVAKIAQAIKPEADGVEQLVFYDKGVGTGNVIDKWLGGATGFGLSRNVMEAYKFLVTHYQPNDQVFLFGFSRGAYTVRSLAGLVHNCGILKKAHLDQIPRAYRFYRSRDHKHHPKSTEAQLFRKTYSQPMVIPLIKCVGVWDTVGALGLPLHLFGITRRWWGFHDVQLSRSIEHAFHALAIDEKRKSFKPTLWEAEQARLDQGQVLEQVWFSGAHSDVGGGARKNNTLSGIALTWMKEKAAYCGLAFEPETSQPEPDHELGQITNSFSWFWKLISRGQPFIRPITLEDRSATPTPDTADTTTSLVRAETLHSTVKERLGQDLNPVYRPPNLIHPNERCAPGEKSSRPWFRPTLSA